MTRGYLWARLSGEQFLSERVSYEVEHVEHDAGEVHSIDVTFDLGGLSLTVDFHLDQAEEFVVRFRDEIVRAKQAELEWETDTDPSTGVYDPEECGCGCDS